MRRTQGLSLSARIGLNSGEVVVGTIGDDLRMEYTAQGHTVGLASRMEQLAGADRAYLTDHTARLVAGYFRLRDLGEFTVKGVTAPLRVHELEATGELRTRLDRSRSRGLSKFVGSRREPAVILFEDLHWIDEATGVFLETLVDAAGASRTLLVVNFRPEYRADWMRRSYYQQLALAPLDAGAFAEMLGETLGTDVSLRDLAGRIHARSGGNPFFAEEIVQTLIESGALVGATGVYRLTRDSAALEIPATVQLVLAARIDRLGEREKSVLQTASVIGREFSASLVRRVAGIDESVLGDALRTLVQAEVR